MEPTPEFYVLWDPLEPPLRLNRLPTRSQNRPFYSALLPASLPAQLVIFSLGDWSGLSTDAKVEVKLENGTSKEHKLGTLTHKSRCFLWEPGTKDVLSWAMESENLSVSMVVHGQVIQSLGAKQERGKRKRIKGKEEENICPNKGSGKGHQAVQKSNIIKGITADTPTGRWGHTLCPIDYQTVILIGGQGTGMQFCKDAMWNLNTESHKWAPVDTLSDRSSPESRTGHTAVFDPSSHRIYVFGGSKNRKWFNDVHILDTETWRWRNIEARGKVPPLSYHSCSLFLGELFVFGGVFPRPHPIPDGCSDSLYIFDPQHEIWYQPIILGQRPRARSGHSACLLHNKLYIFGGWDTPVCFNDLYVLDLGLMEFSAVEVKGTSPIPRCWHTAAPISDFSFLIHGGYDGNKALSDTYIFNIGTKTWTSLIHSSLPCSPRAGHSMLPLTGANDENEETPPRELLIFGGGDNEGAFYSDTIKLSLALLVNQ
ncbi:rab9 effector protein with kelch motifs [Bombina bombina]|uniref:rab9 effector protein with kelch motifs n=1 Tax=Bombina bombina TaxID=8345 RepID=UPI00235A9CB8|nr:rab9 effector protein with kelch motifs [Bombina bombina]